jgi:hypothetical protein
MSGKFKKILRGNSKPSPCKKKKLAVGFATNVKIRLKVSTHLNNLV